MRVFFKLAQLRINQQRKQCRGQRRSVTEVGEAAGVNRGALQAVAVVDVDGLPLRVEVDGDSFG